MNTKISVFLGVAVLGVISLYAAENIKISRLTRGIVNVGGTTSVNGSTLITSTSPTNEFKVVIITPSTSTVATASTNTFATAFLATPTVFIAPKNGSAFSTIPAALAVTATTTGVIVSGMNTNSIDAPNILVYGYTRSGVFE